MLAAMFLGAAAPGIAQQGYDASISRTALPDAPPPSPTLVPMRPAALRTVADDSSSSLAGIGDAGDLAQQPPLQQQKPPDPQPESQDTLKKPEPQNPVPTRQPPQTKRILGLIPNFRSVSTDVKLPPQTVKEKFLTTTDDSFDYSSIFIPAVLAAYSMGEKATPEFGQGALGYGRYFWHSALDQTSENFMVEFFVPVITHEDTRFYTMGRGGFVKRAGYAVTRSVITRSDSGHRVFNLSEVIGAGASAGLSTTYYPSRERSFANVGSQWGLDIGIDAAAMFAKEFWPDINHFLFRGPKAVGGAPQR
jgi:hypothetical protein